MEFPIYLAFLLVFYGVLMKIIRFLRSSLYLTWVTILLPATTENSNMVFDSFDVPEQI
jgi:hypothetical protein